MVDAAFADQVIVAVAFEEVPVREVEFVPQTVLSSPAQTVGLLSVVFADPVISVACAVQLFLSDTAFNVYVCDPLAGMTNE